MAGSRTGTAVGSLSNERTEKFLASLFSGRRDAPPRLHFSRRSSQSPLTNILRRKKSYLDGLAGGSTAHFRNEDCDHGTD